MIFSLQADPDPQVLLRILGVLARRSLVPDHVNVRIVGGSYQVGLILPEADEDTAERLLQNLRTIVPVSQAERLIANRQAAVEPKDDAPR